MHPEFLGSLVAQRRAQLEREAEDAQLLAQAHRATLRAAGPRAVNRRRRRRTNRIRRRANRMRRRAATLPPTAGELARRAAAHVRRAAAHSRERVALGSATRR